MRFIVTGEWSRNRLLQVVVVLYTLYVAGLWVTNHLLYFAKMTLAPSSVVAYYLGDEATYQPARTYQGLLEVTHVALHPKLGVSFAFGFVGNSDLITGFQ